MEEVCCISAPPYMSAFIIICGYIELQKYATRAPHPSVYKCECGVCVRAPDCRGKRGHNMDIIYPA
jgi:hypothetical protein